MSTRAQASPPASPPSVPRTPPPLIQLPAPYAVGLVLEEYGASYDEIGARVGVPAEAVDGLLTIARRKLALMIDGDQPA